LVYDLAKLMAATQEINPGFNPLHEADLQSHLSDVSIVFQQLEQFDDYEIYGHMGEHGQNRDVRITPENVLLFKIGKEATFETLRSEKPEMSHHSSAVIADRLKSVVEHPATQERGLIVGFNDGSYMNNVRLTRLIEPVNNDPPHQRHTAFFDLDGEEYPVPAGQIYEFTVALPGTEPKIVNPN
jgi:hypothetical protein